MGKDRERLYRLYHAVLSMALTCAFVLIINQYYVLKVNIFLCAGFSFIPSILIYLFDLNRKNAISYILLSSIPVLAVLLFLIKRMNPMNALNGLISWCGVYNGTKELYSVPYAVTVVIGLAVLGAIIFYIITKLPAARLVLAVIITGAILILCISGVNINKAVVGICIFYILSIVVEGYGAVYSRRAGQPDKKEGILYLAPICLLLAVLSVALPSKTDPIHWTAFIHAYQNIREQLESWQLDFNFYFDHSESEFSLSMTGFSEDAGKLGTGSIAEDGSVALKITGPQQGSMVYLIGSVNDTYTGSSWEKSGRSAIPGESDSYLDYAEMFFALSRQDMDTLKNNSFLNRKVIKIRYNNIKTRTLFYPLKTSSYDIFSSYKKCSEESPQITFIKARGKGTEYQSIFFDMNLEGEAFQELLRKSDAFSYETAGRINQATADYVQNKILNNDDVANLMSKQNIVGLLEKRADNIKKYDMQLPVGLPDRVRELAYNITKNDATQYDKLKAIEAYLMSFRYTQQPKKAPEDRDFTDYFLFDSQEGYCTSFATAMAVLGRCIGVPTRYVEGFVASCDKEQNGVYPVKNSQAHAWAEAYFEGVGWVPFEATAPFYKSRYTKWPELASGKSQTGQGASSVVKPDPYPWQQAQPEAPVVQKERKNASGAAFGMITILLAAISSFLAVVFVYYFILKLRSQREFDRADYSRKMYYRFLRILELLKREGFVLGQQETVLMLSKRVPEELRFDNVSFREIADIYMRFRYAQANITPEEFYRINTYCKGLSDKQRLQESWWRIWLLEFRFLIQTDRLWKRRCNNT